MNTTERHFRVMPIGRRYQPQHTNTEGRWVWATSKAYDTPREAKAEAYRLAARWLGKAGQTARVLDIPHGD